MPNPDREFDRELDLGIFEQGPPPPVPPGYPVPVVSRPVGSPQVEQYPPVPASEHIAVQQDRKSRRWWKR